MDSVAFPQELDKTPALRERQEKLIKILSALDGIAGAWSSLKQEEFDSRVERIEKDLLDEAKRPNPDVLKLSRLSGKLEMADQYDLDKLKNRYRMELINIKKQING